MLADWVVGILAGEDVRERLPPGSHIEPFARCTDCAERVMQGKGPIPTAEALERAERAGKFTWRRARSRTFIRRRVPR